MHAARASQTGIRAGAPLGVIAGSGVIRILTAYTCIAAIVRTDIAVVAIQCAGSCMTGSGAAHIAGGTGVAVIAGDRIVHTGAATADACVGRTNIAVITLPIIRARVRYASRYNQLRPLIRGAEIQ
jgi:hypothetical protein